MVFSALKVFRYSLLSVVWALFLCALLLSFSNSTWAIERPADELPKLDLSSKLGSKVDLELQFTKSDGKKVALKELFLPNRPVILVPVYYECPRLCGLLLNGVTTLLNALNLKLGTDLSVIVLSFNSAEGVDLAAKRAEKYRTLLTQPAGDPQAWHFLVGDQASIQPLMQQIGFEFKKDSTEYAHTALLTLLTPRGEISQYFTGIEFPAWDVRLALVEASKGAIGSPIDHAFLFCFRFDALLGRYTWAVSGLLKIGGALTLALLGYLVIGLLRRERRLHGQV